MILAAVTCCVGALPQLYDAEVSVADIVKYGAVEAGRLSVVEALLAFEDAQEDPEDVQEDAGDVREEAEDVQEEAEDVQEDAEDVQEAVAEAEYANAATAERTQADAAVVNTAAPATAASAEVTFIAD